MELTASDVEFSEQFRGEIAKIELSPKWAESAKRNFLWQQRIRVDVEIKKFDQNRIHRKRDINYVIFSILPPWGSPNPNFRVTEFRQKSRHLLSLYVHEN